MNPQHSPFCKISRCSQRMSPTKSGASSRKHSLPRAQRAAPFMQNFWKSTPFKLNSFTAHITQSRTCVSVHCWGSAPRGGEKRPINGTTTRHFPRKTGHKEGLSGQALARLHLILSAGIRVKCGGEHPTYRTTHNCRQISYEEQVWDLFGTFINSTSSPTLFSTSLGFSLSSASGKGLLLLLHVAEMTWN